MFKMNIILSDVSRYNGSKGTWKDVFKYYVSNPSFRVIFLHRLYHQWYHILSKIPMGKGLFSLYYKHICRQSGIQLSLGAEIGEGLSLNILVVLLLAVSRLVKIAISSIM